MEKQFFFNIWVLKKDFLQWFLFIDRLIIIEQFSKMMFHWKKLLPKRKLTRIHIIYFINHKIYFISHKNAYNKLLLANYFHSSTLIYFNTFSYCEIFNENGIAISNVITVCGSMQFIQFIFSFYIFFPPTTELRYLSVWSQTLALRLRNKWRKLNFRFSRKFVRTQASNFFSVVREERMSIWLYSNKDTYDTPYIFMQTKIFKGV